MSLPGTVLKVAGVGMAIALAAQIRVWIPGTPVPVTLQTLGYNISGVLALGSIGGIAISFAAKDMLANFFGGVMVYLDRPFAVGDWIRSPDRAIEGTVEHIGWRSTRIRTFDQRPLYVPNAAFTTIAVENPSRMLNRRISETIGIRYCDFAAVGSIVSDVRGMLEQHPDIDTGRTLIVNFNAFGPSSLDLYVYTFTHTTQWVRYHEIKQDVLTFKSYDRIKRRNNPKKLCRMQTGEMPAGCKMTLNTIISEVFNKVLKII